MKYTTYPTQVTDLKNCKN